MKLRKLLFVTAVAALTSSAASAQITLPAPSPAGSVSSVVGLTDVKIEYFRPKMRGRQIFGEGSDFLVPYGQLWRTGANSGTVISFSDDVKLEGQAVPAGKYLVLTEPGPDNWNFILYKDISMGGNTAGFTEENVQAQMTVNATELSQAVEVLTFNIADISEDNTKAAIEMAWENTSVKVGMEVDFDSKVMAAIERNTQVNPQNYVAAANYYFTTGRDMKQAIKWMEMFLPGRESQFWNVHTYAQMLMADQQWDKAREAAQRSLETAKASGNDFGYVKRNEDLIAEIDSKSGNKGKKKKK